MSTNAIGSQMKFLPDGTLVGISLSLPTALDKK